MGKLVFFLVVLIGLCLVAIAWGNEHWPNVPLTSTSCEKIMTLDTHQDALSDLYYSSVMEVLFLTYHFADGTIIETIWDVVDLAHENAADYSFKLGEHMRAYTFRYRAINELWVDMLGEGRCQDFRLKSLPKLQRFQH